MFKRITEEYIFFSVWCTSIWNEWGRKHWRAHFLLCIGLYMQHPHVAPNLRLPLCYTLLFIQVLYLFLLYSSVNIVLLQQVPHSVVKQRARCWHVTQCQLSSVGDIERVVSYSGGGRLCTLMGRGFWGGVRCLCHHQRLQHPGMAAD